jgi:hypothetical protein
VINPRASHVYAAAGNISSSRRTSSAFFRPAALATALT